jgi:flagellar hook-associated protein 3 FlgL
MRISTSQIFSASLNQINSSLVDVATLNAMNSSQKKLNSPSDDPAGMGKVIELRAYNNSLSGYVENCETAGEYLSLADDALIQASEAITAALELAEQASTETYTHTQLQMMAEELEGYFDSLITVANTQMGTDSLFAGNDLDTNAYTVGLGVTLPNATLSNATLSNGSFVSIEGELDSTALYVRMGSDGVVGTDELEYSYSTDGGETWETATLAAGDTVLDLGTCEVELLAGTTVSVSDDETDGSEFIIRETAIYTGSDEAMEVAISESSTVNMTTVGSDVFGGVDEDGTAYSGTNLFETISDCIAYMEIGDYDAVAECLEDLRVAQELIETANANVGARENKVDYTESSLSLVQTITANSISNEEDADAAQILVELEQANYIYEAVLTSSSSIMSMSLLDYI